MAPRPPPLPVRATAARPRRPGQDEVRPEVARGVVDGLQDQAESKQGEGRARQRAEGAAVVGVGGLQAGPGAHGDHPNDLDCKDLNQGNLWRILDLAKITFFFYSYQVEKCLSEEGGAGTPDLVAVAARPALVGGQSRGGVAAQAPNPCA